MFSLIFLATDGKSLQWQTNLEGVLLKKWHLMKVHYKFQDKLKTETHMNITDSYVAIQTQLSNTQTTAPTVLSLIWLA